MNHFSTVEKGFTLPVWVVAAAKAATQVLLGNDFEPDQLIRLPNTQEKISIPVQSTSLIDHGNKALAINYSDPGEVLDITRGMEIWALVQFQKNHELLKSRKNSDEINSWLNLVPGFGFGRHISTGKPSISTFTYELLNLNIRDLVPKGFSLNLEIVFPQGKELAERTSNSAFGVVEGLALIGTQAQVQTSASPDQLKKIIDDLRTRCDDCNFSGDLIFVIGENGFELATKVGFDQTSIIKTGNWIGPSIVAAANSGVKKLLLFGYHGKLIKLAGGIFHTHHHLADSRLEILTYLAVQEGIPQYLIESLSKMKTIEQAFLLLDKEHSDIAKSLWLRIAREIEFRSSKYLGRYVHSSMEIGAVLFDRHRKLRWFGPHGLKQLGSLGQSLRT
ncbi:cobalt-precorrin-5B (C(1))-methyltransferase CbiD [Prochlorococcus sp. MIT 1223]|uniref:cobalt-precorrin-5B (C(1))-methyltransferase CbiD n=1 Tax=Prochlorococcus sp. MIT 1223 TaxID=3096217 RepID=UPI002A75D26E|nr:cobalt-precorrin-5B (C(1))-methyltransferase CbiD [Prochlorococcus sp. MIT 1223]